MASKTDRPLILVTGGAGYIGSHCVIDLVKSGYDVVVVDNLCNSHTEVIPRVKRILGLPERTQQLILYEIDMLDLPAMEVVFSSHRFEAVVHLAGLKSVSESVKYPMKYYRNNLISTINLLQCMAEFSVFKLIFSSSATVYGMPETLPLTENHQVGRNMSNTYGQTKFMIEQMLVDLENPKMHAWSIVILRYFNPVGAHESGTIGEHPSGVPANLMPFVAQVAAGTRPCVPVFGNDYPTADKTGVRDYIHVVDLAVGHVAAMKKLREPGVHIYNLGTGKGYSVLEMIAATEKASGKKIAYEFKSRRQGDLASVYCDPAKAEHELQWKATRELDDMCRDLWNWQSKNKNGYEA